jgi:error-prone DNA polymerase
VLGKTLGVPLFQEQAMKIAIVAPASRPPRPTAAPRDGDLPRVGTIGNFKDKMVERHGRRGYDPRFRRALLQARSRASASYGFPESHAASFALLVYASAWMKCHYPDVFCARCSTAQPMGFYAPAQIVRDAREHGVEVREVDVPVLARGTDQVVLDPAHQGRPRAEAGRGHRVTLRSRDFK